MRATANVLTASTTPYVKLDHGGEEIAFSISVFSRKNFQGENAGTFDHINDYWAQLTEEHQKRIFEVYKAIEYGIDNIYNQKDLTDHLTDRVTELIKEHDLEAVQYWVSNKSNIIIPDVFDVDYQHSFDNNTSREKTYTRSDYVKLVSLSVLLRCMIPVWGEYITHTRQKTGTKFKEYYAFQLLNKSSIIHSSPMEKLKTYVEHIVGDDKFNPDNVHSGISSEDFCYWSVALICIRRLCIGNVSGNEPRAHLVSFIYKFVIRLVQGTDMNSENAIRDKRVEDDRDSNGFGDKISTLERYKFKFNISPGEIAELEVPMENIHEAVKKITYQVDPVLLDNCLKTARQLEGQKLMMPQINIMRWLFKSVISPRGMMYLPNPTVIAALGASEAILWTMGYKYLAVLVTSYPEVNDKVLDMRISPSNSKLEIPEELINKLDILYPFSRSSKNKKPETDKSDQKPVNLTAKSISDISDSLRTFSWRPTCDETMLMDVFGVPNRRTPIRPEVKIELTKLVIDIGQRSWT